MALDIPMPESPGDSLIKGLNAGGDLMHKLMLSKYYNNIHPSGDVANALYVEQMRKQFGENDPRYISAKAALDLTQQGHQSLIGYRDVLNNTAGVRATSGVGKEILEGQGKGAQDILNRKGIGSAAPSGGLTNGVGNVNLTGNTSVNDNYGMPNNANGNNVVENSPDTQQAGSDTGVDNNPRTPEERAAYERSINKKTSDAQARNTLLRAENLDKTRYSINPDDLTRYSGLKGTGNWLKDTAQAAMGNPSDQYLAHQQAMTSVGLMTDQMRQFYGDSIQPTAMDRLRHLANPATWYKDPKVAQAQWNQLNKILDTETQTYRNHASSPITLNKLDFKDGQFTATKNPQASSNNVQASSNASNPPSTPGGVGGSSIDMNKVVPQLMKINPKYTEAAIRSTAKVRGITTDQVINELFQRSVRSQ